MLWFIKALLGQDPDDAMHAQAMQRDAAKPHPFDSFKTGMPVTFAGVPATITHIDDFRDWDAEIEMMELAYTDRNGVVHRE